MQVVTINNKTVEWKPLSTSRNYAIVNNGKLFALHCNLRNCIIFVEEFYQGGKVIAEATEYEVNYNHLDEANVVPLVNTWALTLDDERIEAFIHCLAGDVSIPST